MGQAEILKILSYKNRKRVSIIERKLGQSKSSVNAALKRLKRAKLVDSKMVKIRLKPGHVGKRFEYAEYAWRRI